MDGMDKLTMLLPDVTQEKEANNMWLQKQLSILPQGESTFLSMMVFKLPIVGWRIRLIDQFSSLDIL